MNEPSVATRKRPGFDCPTYILAATRRFPFSVQSVIDFFPAGPKDLIQDFQRSIETDLNVSKRQVQVSDSFSVHFDQDSVVDRVLVGVPWHQRRTKSDNGQPNKTASRTSNLAQHPCRSPKKAKS